MLKPILVLGAGGHAKVVLEALRALAVPVLGLLDTDPAKKGHKILDSLILGGEELLANYSPADVRLVNGVGTTQASQIRQTIFDRCKAKEFIFYTLVHPSAVVAPDVILEEGVQVMAGSVLQPGTRIGYNSIVNTRASIDHDCQIAAHVHVAPGVTLSGGVRIEAGAHLGTGSIIVQNTTIGERATVAAGAVVVQDVLAGTTVYGVPAKER